MNTIQRIERAKKELAAAKSYADRVQGQIDQLQKDIKTKFGVNTMKKAKVLLKELSMELPKLETEQQKKAETVKLLCNEVDAWIQEGETQ